MQPHCAKCGRNSKKKQTRKQAGNKLKLNVFFPLLKEKQQSKIHTKRFQASFMHQWSFFKLRRLHSNLHRMTVVFKDGKHYDSPGAGTFSQATRHFPVIWRHDAALGKKKKRSEEWSFQPGPSDLFASLICTRDRSTRKQKKTWHGMAVRCPSPVSYLQLLSPGLKLTD